MEGEPSQFPSTTSWSPSPSLRVREETVFAYFHAP